MTDVLAKFTADITRQASRLVSRRFGRSGVKYTKENRADVVTEADLAANRLLVQAIKKKFPSHGIVSEEQPDWQKDAEYLWLVDPLDGTRNFSTGTPLFGVMVAVAKNGVLQHAAIADPPNGKLYLAHRGRGATCNGKPVHCAATKDWVYSYGCTGAGLRANKLASLQRLIASAAREPLWLSMFGSAAVAAMYVADGRRDWAFSRSSGGVWDYAAGVLLMEEAGCTVTDMDGKPWTLASTSLVAAVPALHAKLLSLVRES
ncbi:MAG: inositol monophosphatase family protein [bacterium]|nr:inositol monophosphatase family protein [bacterium]